MSPDRSRGRPAVGFLQLDEGERKAVAAIAAGFTGLLSLFNIGGRFFWASLSDRIGRKATYFCFFVLGIVLYALAPTLAHAGSKALFVLAFCIILSMYGGGFSTVPASRLCWLVARLRALRARSVSARAA